MAKTEHPREVGSVNMDSLTLGGNVKGATKEPLLNRGGKVVWRGKIVVLWGYDIIDCKYIVTRRTAPHS